MYIHVPVFLLFSSTWVLWAHFELRFDCFMMHFFATLFASIYLGVLDMFVWTPFWAWLWAFPTGIWTVPCTWAHFELDPEPSRHTGTWAVQYKTTYINIRVPSLMFFIALWIFELILSSVSSFSHCNLSCCVYIDCYALVSCTCSFDVPFGLDSEPSPLEFELSHAKQYT